MITEVVIRCVVPSAQVTAGLTPILVTSSGSEMYTVSEPVEDDLKFVLRILVVGWRMSQLSSTGDVDERLLCLLQIWCVRR